MGLALSELRVASCQKHSRQVPVHLEKRKTGALPVFLLRFNSDYWLPLFT